MIDRTPDENTLVWTTSKFIIPPPPKGDWSFDPHFQIVFMVPHYPCWLYRLMQRVLLGIYWRPHVS